MGQNLNRVWRANPENLLWRMVIVILIALGMTSCEDENERQITYNQSYDELLTLRMNINVLAESLGVKSADLIRMRYGVISVDPEVTEVLSDLCNAFNDFKYDKVKDILTDNYNFEISDKKTNLSQSELIKLYRANTFARNERFDGDIPNLIAKDLTHNVTQYLDKEFAWYRFPINAWHYVWEKDKMATRYRTDLNDILSTENINQNVVSRFNDYSALLEAEQTVLFGKDLTLPDLKKVELDDASEIADSSVLDKFVERASIDLTDTILVLVEEVGIAILIWLIFRWLTNRIINWYARNVLDYDFDRGFWTNAAIFGLNLLNAWAEDEDKRRLARIKTWVQSIVAVIFIIVTYIYVIKPQIAIEHDLIAQVESNVSTYVAKMDVPVLDYFNHVIDSIDL